jgi:hypothetical protein
MEMPIAIGKRTIARHAGHEEVEHQERCHRDAGAEGCRSNRHEDQPAAEAGKAARESGQEGTAQREQHHRRVHFNDQAVQKV